MFKISTSCLLVLLLVAGQASCAIRLLDNYFGYGLYPSDFFDLGFRPLISFPRLRLHPFASAEKEVAGEKSYHVGKEGFQTSLDVRGFQPNEITVKTLDNTVVIEAKHEEREDEHGFISRHFIRRYSLPKGYDPNKVISTLSSDGILTIKAPAPPESDTKSVERIVPVHQTGPAITNIKENEPSSQTTTTTESHPDAKENSVDS